MKKSILLLAASTLLSFQALAAEIRVGAFPTPHVQILEFVKPSLKKQGVDLEIIPFIEPIQTNIALAEGSLDANYFQHVPYLDSFVKESGLPIVSIGGIHIEPIGLYSSKIKDIKELRDGAEIGVTNDPTNTGRTLLLLQKQGLIKLKEPDNISSTVEDVIENKKGLKFILLDQAILPRSLDDLDAAVILTNVALDSGLNPLRDAIVIEDKDSPYSNVIAVTKGRENDEDLKKLVNALRTENVRQFILKEFNGAVVPAF